MARTVWYVFAKMSRKIFKVNQVSQEWTVYPPSSELDGQNKDSMFVDGCLAHHSVCNVSADVICLSDRDLLPSLGILEGDAKTARRPYLKS